MTVRFGTTPSVALAGAVPVARRQSVLDVAVGVLASDPGASLGSIAAAAGIGRTTLHQQYATRQDLLVAVGHHALDQVERGIAAAHATPSEPDPAAPLDRLVRELVPLGDALAYLFRQSSLDAVPEIRDRVAALDPPILELIAAGQDSGVLRTDLPDWWFVSTLYAQVYVAWEAVARGRLAPLDAPDLVLCTLVDGLAGPGVPGTKPGTTGAPR